MLGRSEIDDNETLIFFEVVDWDMWGGRLCDSGNSEDGRNNVGERRQGDKDEDGEGSVCEKERGEASEDVFEEHGNDSRESLRDLMLWKGNEREGW